MKGLTWKILLVVVLIGIAFYQLSFSWKYFNLTEEQKKEMKPSQIDKLHKNALHLGLDLQGGMHIVLEVDTKDMKKEEAKGAVERALEIIRNRIDQFGVSEPLVEKQGENRIVVELPGIVDRDRARKLIGKTAQLEFHLVIPQDETQSIVQKIIDYSAQDSLLPDLTGVMEWNGIYYLVPDIYVNDVKKVLSDPNVQAKIPKEYAFYWGKEISESGRSYRPLYLLKKKPELTGAAILDAKAGVGTANNPMGAKVELTMTREARGKWAAITGANIGRNIAIVLDDIVQTAPRVKERIPSGNSEITLGNNDLDAARDLAIVLRAGALPAPVKIIEERSVGPTLGRDSINEGIRAIIVGMILIALFMIVYYSLSGVIAVFALALNVVFVLAILSLFRATLTLPGIAGLVLTIGTAIDANVLIFERIREEIRRGKTVRAAIDYGYSKAFNTILDANATSFLMALVLYWFGTGPIKGFAVTLSIGIVVSFFTAIFVTRIIFDLIYSDRNIKKIWI